MILVVLRLPCSTCPYRCDTPPGVWHPSHRTSRSYSSHDAPEPRLALFMCHEGDGEQRVCRGWLTVHAESIAVRVALIHERLTLEQVYAEVPIALHPTGRAAMEYGLSAIDEPPSEAVVAIRRLIRRGRVHT